MHWQPQLHYWPQPPETDSEVAEPEAVAEEEVKPEAVTEEVKASNEVVAVSALLLLPAGRRRRRASILAEQRIAAIYKKEEEDDGWNLLIFSYVDIGAPVAHHTAYKKTKTNSANKNARNFTFQTIAFE